MYKYHVILLRSLLSTSYSTFAPFHHTGWYVRAEESMHHLTYGTSFVALSVIFKKVLLRKNCSLLYNFQGLLLKNVKYFQRKAVILAFCCFHVQI